MDSLRVKKGEINSKLIISASRIMDATDEKELLSILREVGAFIGRAVDNETVRQETARQEALASFHARFQEKVNDNSDREEL